MFTTDNLRSGGPSSLPARVRAPPPSPPPPPKKTPDRELHNREGERKTKEDRGR